VDKFQLSAERFLGKLETKCRPRAVLEAARFFASCFASTVEFGPQHFTDTRTTRPASKIFSNFPWWSKYELPTVTSTFFTELFGGNFQPENLTRF
jgi:hypothetical protein